MAEYSAVAEQTVNPGETVVFTLSPVPCNRGFVRHRDDSGSFLLSGYAPRCKRSAMYLVDCGMNIAIPEGGTVGPIQVSLALDGNTISGSTMIVTPAAVGEYFNVSRAIHVPVWRGCCQTISIRNTSDQPILVQNANIIFERPDLSVSY